MCAGHSASRQVVTLLKSIFIHRHTPLHFHFISDSVAQLILSTLFNSWGVPAGKLPFLINQLVKLIMNILISEV